MTVSALAMLGEAGFTPVTLPDPDAWAAQFSGLADQIEAAIANTMDRYESYVNVATTLGQPVTSAAGDDSVWTAARAQDLANARAMALFTIAALREGAAGQRQLLLLADGNWALRSKDTDLYHVALDADGVPTLYDKQSDPVIASVPTTLGFIQIPIEVAIVAAATVVWVSAIAGAVYAITNIVDALGNVVDRVADVMMTRSSIDCLKTSPAVDCELILDALRRKQTAVIDAEAAKKAAREKYIADMILYTAAGASVLGIVYAAVKLGPELIGLKKSERAPSAA